MLDCHLCKDSVGMAKTVKYRLETTFPKVSMNVLHVAEGQMVVLLLHMIQFSLKIVICTEEVRTHTELVDEIQNATSFRKVCSYSPERLSRKNT